MQNNISELVYFTNVCSRRYIAFTTQMVKHELYGIWLFSWRLWGSTNTLAHIINCHSLQSSLMNMQRHRT